MYTVRVNGKEVERFDTITAARDFAEAMNAFAKFWLPEKPIITVEKATQRKSEDMSATTKKVTPWAAAAKEIRKELRAKWPGVRFSVRSESYASGSAVRVKWKGGPRVEEVRDVVAKYEYGHFDPITDCYYYTNRRDNLPQVQFVSLNRE